MNMNVEPIPPNDRSGLTVWLRRLAAIVAALILRLDAIEKKIRDMED